MGHVLRIITQYGAQVDTTIARSIDLTEATAGVRLVEYVPTPPPMETQIVSVTPYMSGARMTAYGYGTVTETIKVWLDGNVMTTPPRTYVNAIEEMLAMAARQQVVRDGPIVSLYFQPGSSGTAYRSPIIAGKVQLEPDTLGWRWGANQWLLTITITRYHYWETVGYLPNTVTLTDQATPVALTITQGQVLANQAYTPLELTFPKIVLTWRGSPPGTAVTWIPRAVFISALPASLGWGFIANGISGANYTGASGTVTIVGTTVRTATMTGAGWIRFVVNWLQPGLYRLIATGNFPSGSNYVAELLARDATAVIYATPPSSPMVIGYLDFGLIPIPPEGFMARAIQEFQFRVRRVDSTSNTWGITQLWWVPSWSWLMVRSESQIFLNDSLYVYQFGHRLSALVNDNRYGVGVLGPGLSVYSDGSRPLTDPLCQLVIIPAIDNDMTDKQAYWTVTLRGSLRALTIGPGAV